MEASIPILNNSDVMAIIWFTVPYLRDNTLTEIHIFENLDVC